jgi:O-antigen ligase
LQAFIPQAGAKWGMSAIFNHPAHAAYFVGIMASFAVADLVVQPARADRPLRLQLALLALLGAGLLITNTRAAWLGMLVSIVLVLWLEARTMRARRIATGLLAGLSAAGALLLATYRPLWESFSGKLASYALGVERYILGTYLWNQGIDYRFFAFFAGLQVFADHVVFGVGPGRFGGWVAYEFPSPVYQEYAIPFLGGVLAQSDNFWIHLLAESGLAGFLLFAAALVVLYRGCRRLYRDHPDVEVRRLALGAMLSFVFVVVVGFFAPILEGPPAPYYFWGLAGALLGGAALRAKRP